MKGRDSIVHGRTRRRSRCRALELQLTSASVRYETALALYPRYLAFMEERGSDAGFPQYDFRAAAGDAVRAADYLIEAIEEEPK